jgi:hypothetical protein
MQSERARRLDLAGSFADASGMAAKPQVISEATAREDQLPMGVG